MKGTVPDALLKLLVKDKPLYSGKVRERRETKPRSEERGTRLEQMRDRLKIITADKDQPARKVSS